MLAVFPAEVKLNLFHVMGDLANDEVARSSSVCLGLTCKLFYDIHKKAHLIKEDPEDPHSAFLPPCVSLASYAGVWGAKGRVVLGELLCDWANRPKETKEKEEQRVQVFFDCSVTELHLYGGHSTPAVTNDNDVSHFLTRDEYVSEHLHLTSLGIAHTKNHVDFDYISGVNPWRQNNSFRDMETLKARIEEVREDNEFAAFDVLMELADLQKFAGEGFLQACMRQTEGAEEDMDTLRDQIQGLGEEPVL